MPLVEVTIGRCSGPCTDRAQTTWFLRSELNAVLDTLAVINAATQGKERWYADYAGKTVIPSIKGSILGKPKSTS